MLARLAGGGSPSSGLFRLASTCVVVAVCWNRDAPLIGVYPLLDEEGARAQ
jgi:hypothetical protein